jgi:hypothetical protein
MTDRAQPRHIEPDSFGAMPSIAAGFSQRQGGVSEGPFASLNLGLRSGDRAERVLENRRRLFRPLGFDVTDLAVAGQVHGSDVRVVKEPGLYGGCDGLVTTEAHLPLCITSADCTVVLLADPQAGVVGACHSGWRGTVEKVAAETVRRMIECGAAAAGMRAYISPCISTEHFEVGPEVANRFCADHVVRRADWPKPHVDLKGALASQLIRAGIDGRSVEISGRCTFAETDSFYSYRAEGGRTGRMMGFIALRL